MQEKLQQFLVIVATVGMIIFNWLAATGFRRGTDTGAVSDKYDTHITPAGYAFAIWSLIYLGMIAFSIYQALPVTGGEISRFADDLYRKLRRQLRVALCLESGINRPRLGIIIVLLVSIGIINVKLRETETIGEFWLAKVPFGIYFGWVTAATILNATIALVYLGVKLPDSTSNLIGAGLILIAAALGAIVRWKLINYIYPLAIAWALTAIAVKQSGQTIIVVAAAFGVIVCLIAAVSFVMDMNSSTSQNTER